MKLTAELSASASVDTYHWLVQELWEIQETNRDNLSQGTLIGGQGTGNSIE